MNLLGGEKGEGHTPTPSLGSASVPDRYMLGENSADNSGRFIRKANGSARCQPVCVAGGLSQQPATSHRCITGRREGERQREQPPESFVKCWSRDLAHCLVGFEGAAAAAAVEGQKIVRRLVTKGDGGRDVMLLV